LNQAGIDSLDLRSGLFVRHATCKHTIHGTVKRYGEALLHHCTAAAGHVPVLVQGSVQAAHPKIADAGSRKTMRALNTAHSTAKNALLLGRLF
jgi:hypothetical protein